MHLKRFPLWPAKGTSQLGNGFEAYWRLFGRPRDLPVSQAKPYFEIPEKDAERINALLTPARAGSCPPPLN